MKIPAPTGKIGRRGLRRLWAAAAMFLVAASVFGSLFYLQRRATQFSFNQQMARRTPRQAPDLTPQQKAEALAKASQLRDKWRVWAQQHRPELARMLRAKPDDQAAMLTVWEDLPITPRQLGVTPKDLDPGGASGEEGGFTWVPIGKAADNPKAIRRLKPEVQKVLLEGRRIAAERRQDEFQTQRDIVISSSMGGGASTHILLWASGRITEQSKLPPEERPNTLKKLKALGRPARESDLHGPHREIVPPYEFLLQTNSK